VFYCPAQDERCQWRSDAPGPVYFAGPWITQFGYELGERLLMRDLMYFSYGYNSAGSGVVGVPGRGMGTDFYISNSDRGARRATSVKNPSEFIMIADAAADAHVDGDITPYASGSTDSSVGAVHRGGANILYCDGHVQWHLRSDVTIAKPPGPADAAKQRLWNVDFEPAKQW
jgi:prepilin-type processing-associated H-X9-DG protein